MRLALSLLLVSLTLNFMQAIQISNRNIAITSLIAHCPKLQVSALADYYAVECSFVDGENWSIHCRRTAAY